jgi:CheY-like chemotaxis protein
MKDPARRKILLVDDDADVRQTLAMLLEMMGLQVTEAADAATALRVFLGDDFDCVVTDYTMPGMKGDELARLIKAAKPGQRVVMVSGYAESVRIHGRLPACLDALLAKPCSPAELQAAVAGAGNPPW